MSQGSYHTEEAPAIKAMSRLENLIPLIKVVGNNGIQRICQYFNPEHRSHRGGHPCFKLFIEVPDKQNFILKCSGPRPPTWIAPGWVTGIAI